MDHSNFWNHRIKEGAVLNPVDRISEVLFGLIMVLTFTGTVSVATDGRQQIRELLWAALGCNVAWGLVDAIMYIMNVLVERGHGIVVIRKIQQTKTNEECRAILKEEIQPVVVQLLEEKEMDNVITRLKQLPQPNKKSLFTIGDLMAGIQIFLLVFLCTLPVALPFAMLDDVSIALRASNGVALLLLFIGGFLLARYAGFRPVITAIAYTIIGVILVLLTMALGG